MINYAHRGASEYAPENTLSSFYLGLLMGANGIETDVQMTRDGVAALFHDEKLERVTNARGVFSDYTLEELKSFNVTGNATCGFYDKIITLEEFLNAFSKYDISFEIELKGEGVEEETLRLIRKFNCLEKTTFTSFKFEYIKKIKELCPEARVGWLVYEGTDEEVEKLLSIGGEEIAPKAEYITEELMKKWRGAGLGVRAWGVTSVALMKKAFYLSVDGMTVNFPDRLTEYINSKK